MTHRSSFAADFDPALAEAVCVRVACGARMTTIGREDGMPGWPVIAGWLARHPEFCQQFADARALHLELMADETLDAADRLETVKDSREPTPGEMNARTRMMIETRHWIMSKRDPEKYGRVSGRHAAEKAAEKVVRERDLAREAKVVAAKAQAKADHQILVDEVVWAKRNGTCAEASLELAGCILPLTRYVTEGCRRFNADALNRDFCTRRMVAGLLLGAPPKWGEFSATRFDPDLFAAMTAVRKEGDGPITLPPGPLPGGEREVVEPKAADDEPPVVDDADDEAMDPRFAAVEAAFNGPPAPASPGYYSPMRRDTGIGVVITDYDIHADLKGWNNSS